MWGARCRACEAKDSEIAHLRSHLERLSGMVERAQARIVEVERPGAERAVRAAERTPRTAREAPAPPPRYVPTFPGYEPEERGPRLVVEEPAQGAEGL